MDITVAVLTRNETANIDACLASLVALKYTGGKFEILVVDGMSDDDTRLRAAEWANRYPQIRLVDNTKKHIAGGRNVAWREARFPQVAFTDADCRVPAEWLSALAAGFTTCRRDDPQTVAVGGGNTAPASTDPFREALAIMLDSLPGSGLSPQGRSTAKVRRVESLPGLNVLYDKAAIAAVGGYDEALESMGEDLDLNLRLGASGGSLYALPGLMVEHALRGDAVSWGKNMYGYGTGRVRVCAKHGRWFHPRIWIPAAWLLVMLATLFGSRFARRLALAYLAGVSGCAAGLVVRSGKSGLAARVAGCFLVTHACYAAGIAAGILAHLAGHDGARQEHP
ncbi:MAG TPA: glycosyltransferase [Candidatus Ozemobacteraceae bacterium]|nr:glycosyltransferase [Candidatus Ozemobacteraceae bacterium]